VVTRRWWFGKPPAAGPGGGAERLHRYFFDGDAPRRYDAVPDRLVAAPETVRLGGVELGLYPVRGGETADGLLVL
jgi:hypothetical protein